MKKLSIVECYEALQIAKDIMGSEAIVDELDDYLDVDELNDFLDHLNRMHELDLPQFKETLNNDEDED